MPVTYPLTFPAVGVTDSRFALRRIIGSTMSEFTGQEQFYRHQGEWWEGEVSFRPMRRADAALVQAFVAELRGRSGTFLYGDPDALAQGFMGAGGTILVNGAGQTGNDLNVDGMTISSTRAKAGDYFQLGTGLDARLYMFTKDLASNGSGVGVASFEPRLRVSPADNQALIISSPRGLMRLSENVSEWQSDKSGIYNITLSFREAL
jgi:hypothetical protein